MPSSYRSDVRDYTLTQHHSTDLSILVSDDGIRAHAKWLPKKAIEVVKKGGQNVTITIPDWLAIEKGLA